MKFSTQIGREEKGNGKTGAILRGGRSARRVEDSPQRIACL